MLKKLRSKKTQKKILVILAILIVPAFVLWGSGSLMRSKEESMYVGRIFGKKVSFLEYKGALDATKNLAIIQYGDDFSEMQKSLNFDSQAWERLILLAEAKSRKIKVSDREVMGLIGSYPFFQRDGKFDNVIYPKVLRYVFQTQPRIFEEESRQNIMLSKLYRQVTNKVNLTDKEIKEEYKKLNEQVSLHYITGSPASFTKEISVTDKEIKDYFQKKSIQFKQPLSFNMEYVFLTQDVNGQEALGDKIQKIFLRLKKGEDFAKVAKDFGLTLKETGIFAENDPIPGIGWSPQIMNLISKAKIDQYLSPIQIDKNYYILKVKERKEPYIPDFETIKDKVKETFIKDKSKEVIKERMKNCLKKLNELYAKNPKSVNFERAAKVFGLKSGSTDLFKYGGYIEGIGVSDKFWLAAQNLKNGEFSGVIEMPSGFYIIKVKSRIPIDEKKFETEKETFSKIVLAEKKQEYFLEFIEKLKRKAQKFSN